MANPVSSQLPAVPPNLCVIIRSGIIPRISAGFACAKEMGLPIHKLESLPENFDTALVIADLRLELRVLRGDDSLIGGHGVASELATLDTKSGAGRSLGQPILKAIGIKRRNPYRPTVLDVTAGLGEDAWVMASVGCVVSACERNPVTYALLADGLRRANEADPQTAELIEIIKGNGVAVLLERAKLDRADRPDVVYLDPMFPLGRKTAERKAMRVLRMISGDDADADQLLEAALQTATNRVVVKRPRLAPPLPGPAPAVIHKGKSLRFDVYLVGAKQ
jgi:16S rRNA (guanine1516-N2)-methyltransferase